jgi:glycosyltransferase involved in cell wall biosynthesis
MEINDIKTISSRFKVIISTGIGPLHLMTSAIHLSKRIDIKVIQSWNPRNTDTLTIRLFSMLIKHKHLSAGLKKRNPHELLGRLYSCAFPDFFNWGLYLLFTILKLPSKRMISGWAWKIYGKMSKKYIQDADIFHVRSGAGQGGAIIEAKKKGMKIIVDHSIPHPGYMEKNLKSDYQRQNIDFDLGTDSPLFKLTIKDVQLADIILVNSFFVKDTFIQEGFDPAIIKVVYLGVRNDFIGLKKTYEVNQQITLLFTGALSVRKGAEYLLKALELLEFENFIFKMKIIGSHNQAKPLLEKTLLKNIELIEFIPQDQLKTYLSDSDIYLFPSLSEGCASSAMEALAAGLPVIATQESGLPIIHGIDGILVPSKDYLALAESIKSLSIDIEKRKFLGSNASKKVKENYTWQSYASNLNLVYNDVLNFC